jgi:sulfoxide reductase catalytic subunit YedY
MLFKKASDIPSSEITLKDLYLNRRTFMAGAGAVVGAAAGARVLGNVLSPVIRFGRNQMDYTKSQYSTSKQTPLNDITHYNNYYEFSTDKYEPAELAKNSIPARGRSRWKGWSTSQRLTTSIPC